ncbi:MAG: pallilysin-related adhesin [Spirochaetales bacterium]|nr:pallilysin-related adhesin [Spirochaetales bacterium]
MKAITAVLPLFLLVLLAGCMEQKAAVPPAPTRPEQITPRTGDYSEESGGEENSSGQEEKPADFIELKIPLEEDEQPILAVHQNLDLDSNEEQYVIVRRPDSENGGASIHMLIADYDSIRREYVRSFEAELKAEDTRSVSIQAMDLIGDHIIELVCRGVNREGNQTLDVFRKSLSPDGLGLYYRNIASIEADGIIEIEEVERSQAYHQGRSNGESFQIITYKQDPESENIMDLLKTSYYWNNQEKSYVLTQVKKVPGKKVEETRLRELFRKGEEAFEAFLSGPWFRATMGNVNTEKTGGDILMFDVMQRSITFSTGDVQEIYSWDNSHRTIYRGLYINCTNESITSLHRQISISVQAMDTIEVSVEGKSEWNGVYQRLSEDVMKTMLNEKVNPGRLNSLKLEGLYTSNDGSELYFSSPEYTLKRDDSVLKGGYVVYEMQDHLIEMTVLGSGGLVQERHVYRIEYKEDKKSSRIIRSITLTPGVISVHGFEPAEAEDKLIFEQVEIIEDQQEKDQNE